MREDRVDLAQRWRALADRFGNVLVGANALVLMLLSWTPGMPRTGIVSGHVEHWLAYAFSGVFMYAVRIGRWRAWQCAAMLSTYAGVLELGQIFVPSRHASVADFFFSATGAIAGVLASALLLKRAPAGSE
jgi:VanZ family protein